MFRDRWSFFKSCKEALSGELWVHLSATLGRVLAAFGLAWIVGVFFGVLLGRSDALDRWFWPWVNVFLNMPALVVIVICYLGLGMTELAAVLAVVINKAPLIAVNVRDGFANSNLGTKNLRKFTSYRGCRS